MAQTLYITDYCIIRQQRICKSGEVVWQNEKEKSAESFFLDAYKHLNNAYPKFFKMDSLSKLGWLASEVLLENNGIQEKYKPEEVSVVFANASSSLDADIKYCNTIKDIPSPALFVYTLPNIVIGEICIRNGFKGENAFFIFDRFEVNFLQQYVASLMLQNTNKACIFGWVEVMDDAYEAALFLVEKNAAGKAISFTEENINKLYS